MRPKQAGLAFLLAAILSVVLISRVFAQEPPAATPDLLAEVTEAPTEATPESTPEQTEAPSAPSPISTATAPGSFTTYTVVAGDTLFSIARRFNTTAAIIAADNGITNPELIYAGQQLKIRTSPGQSVTPLPPTATRPASQPTATRPASGATTYTVAPGDTLGRIARRFGVSTVDITRANNLSDADLIYIGQVLVIPVGGATESPAEAMPPFSFDFGVEVFLRNQNAAAVTPLVTQLGMRWVKLEVDWRSFEPTQGQIDFATLDTMIAALEQNGVKILLTVSTSPTWARSSADEVGPPDDFADYATFVGALAGRYAGRVQAYEIWSEPNLRREWNSNVHTISADSYIDLLRQAHTAIKAADADTLVISAGLAPTGFNDGINAVNDRLYLDALYKAGLKDVSDAIAAHPGGWANPPDSLCCDAPVGVSTHFEDKSFYFLETLNDYRAIMVQNDDSETPIWVTKFGWGTSEDTDPPNATYIFVSYTSLGEQAIYTPRAYELGAQLGFVGPMFLYNLNGCQATTSAEVCYYSLIAPNGSPRPVFSAVAALDKTIATPTPTPTITATPTLQPTAGSPAPPTNTPIVAPTFTPKDTTEEPTAEPTSTEEPTSEATPVIEEPADEATEQSDLGAVG